ncbi:hypothetical protein MMC31_004583, partial [Peltigera leucophlebia]|nr:hypothetical protein [Peltigera leucophlebia]
MSSSEEAHRRRGNNIDKSTATTTTTAEPNIPADRITDRQRLKAAASSSPGREGRGGLEPDGSGSLLAGTALGTSAREVIRDALPALVPWTIIFSLIFGGCCSNVGSSFLHKEKKKKDIFT